MKYLSLIVITLILAGCGSDSSNTPPTQTATPVSTATPTPTPQALIIGDDISLGYAPNVTLAGYNVVHAKNALGIAESAADTTYGLTKIDTYLEDKTWDVVIFNWGIEDFSTLSGFPTDSLADYANNLTELVKKIKAHSKLAIFVTTTDVQSTVPNMSNATTIAQYASAASNVMSAEDVTVLDINSYSNSIGFDHVSNTDFRYNSDGYVLLGDYISNQLKNILASNPI